MRDSWTGASISSRSGHLSTLPVSPSWSAGSRGTSVRDRGPLDAPPLPESNAVVGLRCDVLDPENLEARRLERANRGLPPRAGPFHEHLDLLETVLHAFTSSVVRSDLGGERG